MPANLLTVTEAAERLGVRRQQVHKWIQQDRLKATRLGAQYFIEQRHCKKPKPATPGPKPKVQP